MNQTFKVSDKVKSFGNAAVGDQVIFPYTEAISIDVAK